MVGAGNLISLIAKSSLRSKKTEPDFEKPRFNDEKVILEMQKMANIFAPN